MSTRCPDCFQHGPSCTWPDKGLEVSLALSGRVDGLCCWQRSAKQIVVIPEERVGVFLVCRGQRFENVSFFSEKEVNTLVQSVVNAVNPVQLRRKVGVVP